MFSLRIIISSSNSCFKYSNSRSLGECFVIQSDKQSRMFTFSSKMNDLFLLTIQLSQFTWNRCNSSGLNLLYTYFPGDVTFHHKFNDLFCNLNFLNN